MDIHRCIFLFWLLLVLRLPEKNQFCLLGQIKASFIKILNTEQDGIWSEPLPGNIPAQWLQDIYCRGFYGQNSQATILSHEVLLLFSNYKQVSCKFWSRHIKKGSKSHLKSSFVKIGFEFFSITMFNMLCSLYVYMYVGRLNIKETTWVCYFSQFLLSNSDIMLD